jgi:hypothetical protein
MSSGMESVIFTIVAILRVTLYDMVTNWRAFTVRKRIVLVLGQKYSYNIPVKRNFLSRLRNEGKGWIVMRVSGCMW